jgi:hypothetical protein
MHDARSVRVGLRVAGAAALLFFGFHSTHALAQSQTQAQVLVQPGQSIQAAIEASPPGSTIVLAPGYHRMQEIFSKDGMTFLGQPGAILSGAKELTGWVQSGPVWYVDGQTQQGSEIAWKSGACLPEAVRCLHPEDLFVDDQLLFHTDSLANGGPGKWFFDYAADRIYMWDDPTGHRVETSVTPFAFGGHASNVTIQQLIIEKFATPVQTEAVRGGAGWRIDRTEVRWNHAIGVQMADRRVIIWSNIHHNGQLGIGGTGTHALVEANDIAYNNTIWFDSNLEAGGAKFTFSDHLTVRGNYVHHNRGPGLHTDEGNYNVLYEHNRSEFNAQSGIQHEVSYDAVIRYNYLRGNGTSKPYPYWVDGSGIQIATSYNVEVYGNTLENNWQGITGLDQARGAGRYGPYSLTNLNVHDNVIDVSNALGTGSGRTGIAGTDMATWTTKNNSFYNNTYKLGPYQDYFTWVGDEFTEAEWQNFGHDQTSTFTRAGSF